MADAEVLDLSKARRVPVKQADMAVQIKEQLRQDAHKQKSHREFDEYMSQNQSGYILTAMLQALSDEPQNPFKAMADRLRAPNEGHNLTVIGTDLQEIMRKDPYLSQLHPEVFDDIFQQAEELDFQKDQTLFKKGEAADAIALITRGSVRVGDRIVTRGHVINMNAIHQGSVYNDTVIGESDGKYVIFDKKKVNQALLNSSIKESYTRGTFFQNVLKQRFPQLSQSEILLLSQLAKPIVYESGQIIAEKNDQLSSFVVITQVFGMPATESAVEQMHSNVDNHLIFQEKPAPRTDEAAVTPGNIIGLEGVLIGREERRDWICDGVVEGYVIEADDLKLRGELMKKLKENIQ